MIYQNFALIVGWHTPKKRLIKEVSIHHKKDGFFLYDVLNIAFMSGLPTNYKGKASHLKISLKGCLLGLPP